MAQHRPGNGGVYSSTDAKAGLGRNTFRRPSGSHVGKLSRSTEWLAGNKIQGKQPNAREIEVLLRENPRETRIYRAQGMSDTGIFHIFNERE